MLYLNVELSLPAWLHQEVDTQVIYANDETRVALAISLARRNVQLRTGGPFGAAIFTEEGRIVSVGVNRVVPTNSSMAHAEMMAFASAQARSQRYRLNADGSRHILATSAQPCSMCFGASIWAGIDELLIGARAEDVTELSEFDEGPLPSDWVGELERRGIRVRRDVLRQSAREVFNLYRDANGTRY